MLATLPRPLRADNAGGRGRGDVTGIEHRCRSSVPGAAMSVLRDILNLSSTRRRDAEVRLSSASLGSPSTLERLHGLVSAYA